MATKFCEIFTLLLTTVHTAKSKVKISQNFVAFAEYMNFNKKRVKTAVHCAVVNSNYDLVGKTRLLGVEQIKEVRQLGDLFPVWN